jgi:hypothetical protein
MMLYLFFILHLDADWFSYFLVKPCCDLHDLASGWLQLYIDSMYDQCLVASIFVCSQANCEMSPCNNNSYILCSLFAPTF